MIRFKAGKSKIDDVLEIWQDGIRIGTERLSHIQGSVLISQHCIPCQFHQYGYGLRQQRLDHWRKGSKHG